MVFKINTLVIFGIVFLLLISFVSADKTMENSIEWNNLKTVGVLNDKIKIISPDYFTHCSIAPDGYVWDKCVAYVEIQNNLTNIANSNIAFSASWSKANKIANLTMSYTKDFKTREIEFIKSY